MPHPLTTPLPHLRKKIEVITTIYSYPGVYSVNCSHFTFGNPKRYFSTILFIRTSDYSRYLRTVTVIVNFPITPEKCHRTTMCHLDPPSRLATTHGPKIGGPYPLGEGELGPHLTQYGQGRGLPACQVSSWSVQPFGHSAPTLQTDRTDRQTTV